MQSSVRKGLLSFNAESGKLLLIRDLSQLSESSISQSRSGMQPETSNDIKVRFVRLGVEHMKVYLQYAGRESTTVSCKVEEDYFTKDLPLEINQTTFSSHVDRSLRSYYEKIHGPLPSSSFRRER